MKNRKEKLAYLKNIKENGIPPKFMILMEHEVNGRRMLSGGGGQYYEMDHVFSDDVHVIKIVRARDDDDQSDKD